MLKQTSKILSLRNKKFIFKLKKIIKITGKSQVTLITTKNNAKIFKNKKLLMKKMQNSLPIQD